MAVAGRAAQAYAGNGRLAALTVAGSVGAGLADRFSDLELDCYWSSAPGDADRTGPIDALGGELAGFSEYEQDDQEWGDGVPGWRPRRDREQLHHGHGRALAR